ncbi:MAG: UvrD-helicase domain-containing protein [Gudongella sp.]|jgi:ATP-dependent helicase/nuclease subunit A|nr:UvrD-helicase domain-containing protein [Gudongella sp.]
MDKESLIRERLLSDFETNYMVEAGAGAGKTTLVIQRILNQITNLSGDKKPLKLDEIAAITFTEKAANELKLRVAQGIDKMIKETTDSHKRDLILQAKNSIDDQFVGTIHSFCREILSRNSFEAGLGLDYKVIDNDEDWDIRNLVWKKYLIENETEIDGIVRLLKRLDISMEDINSVFEHISNYEYGIFDYDENVKNVEPPFEALADVVDPLVAIFVEEGKGELMTIWGNPIEKVLNTAERAAINTYYFKRSERNLTNFAKIIISKLKKDGLITSKNFAKTEEGKKVNLSVDKNRLIQAYDELNIYKHDLVIATALPAVLKYTEYKRQIMAVSFDDLLVLTRDLLRESENARIRTREKYKCLYIDEFQDTDAIQSEIMFYLNGETVDEKTPWHERKLIPGSTFIVGDPKQSIYRFRGADIKQYNRVKEIFSNDTDCEVAILRRNYRTQSDIVEWVESVFKLPENCEDELKESVNGSIKFLLDESASFQASFFGMESQRKDSECPGEKTISGVKQFIAGDKDRVGEYRKDESEWVAAYIEKHVKEGFVRETTEIDTGNVKRYPIQYGDFLVLLYNTKGMTDYISALKEKNIPVSYAGKLKLGNIAEIANFIDLVEYLADPLDEFKLCNVLINCFGIKNLEKWKRTGESGTGNIVKLTEYYESESEYDEGPVYEAIRVLKSFLMLKDKSEPLAFMEMLMDEYILLYTENYNDTLIKSIAGTLYYLLEKLSAKNLPNFEIAARELVLLKELDTDREMLLEESESGHVRVMNLHKAKGLEAPIVILATGGTDYEHEVTVSTMQTDRGKEVYMALHQNRSLIGHCAQWEGIKALEKINIDAEKLRLMYVAATRSINALIISGWNKNSWKLLKDGNNAFIPTEFIEGYTDKKILMKLDKDKVINNVVEIINKRNHMIEEVTSKQYLEKRPSKLIEEDEFIEGNWNSSYKGPSGTLWGNVVHRAFELYFIDVNNEGMPNTAKSARQAVEEFKEESDFSNSMEILESILNNFTSNDLIKNLLIDGAKFMPELRFDLVKQEMNPPEYIAGIIDLYIVSNKGVYLLDYKTNFPRGTEEEFISSMVNTYKPQVDMYSEFVLENLGKEVIGRFIYLTVPNKLVELND